MAKSQQSGTKILLALKGCEVQESREDKESSVVKVSIEVKEICPSCGSVRLCWQSASKPREALFPS